MELLIFADDWGRHPSSCQHLARRLSREHAITWVNTIGTRAPRFNRVTAQRAWDKAWEWFGGRRSGPIRALPPPNLTVLGPVMWPWVASRVDCGINRELLLRQLVPRLAARPRPAVAVTTVPVVADLVGALPVQYWVYYCVDDFGQWPGLEQEALQRLEGDLVKRADLLIAASGPLRDRLQGMGRPAHLLTHGVDLDHWSTTHPGRPIEGLDKLPRPLVVFWGLVDRRLDQACLVQLSMAMERGTLLLVGPEQDPDPALGQLPRVTRWPPLPYDRLPDLARAASVLIMPYADMPVARAMQPLKLKEYLATGLPVVTTDLPSTREWADALDLTRSPRDFSAAVQHRLETGLPDHQRAARARLAGESWDAKARQFARWLAHRPCPDPGPDRPHRPMPMMTGG